MAAAVLLVEAAAIDGDFGDHERAAMTGILEREFDLSGDELEILISEAAAIQNEPTICCNLPASSRTSIP